MCLLYLSSHRLGPGRYCRLYCIYPTQLPGHLLDTKPNPGTLRDTKPNPLPNSERYVWYSWLSITNRDSDILLGVCWPQPCYPSYPIYPGYPSYLPPATPSYLYILPNYISTPQAFRQLPINSVNFSVRLFMLFKGIGLSDYLPLLFPAPPWPEAALIGEKTNWAKISWGCPFNL